jgi:hypothetical protein
MLWVWVKVSVGTWKILGSGHTGRMDSSKNLSAGALNNIESIHIDMHVVSK